ncbi:hypothetical protein HY626_03450 [Candidatus Uhrbacteria bacterium]|nr:hypothetical protein [Candidatus Uhrbacteria bacterium]
MSRHYVLDFDGTLFDTDTYYMWIVGQFVDRGVDAQCVRVAAEELFLEGYTVERHARQLRLAEHVVQNIVEQNRLYIQQQHPPLVFSDVTAFFLRFKEAEKSILTFGDNVFQRERVLASGLNTYISEVRVASPEESKASHLITLVESSFFPIVFIEDDPHQLVAVHEANLPVELIRMRREGQAKAKHDHPLDHQAWRVIRSFDELQ